jgi:hypothetical protein
MDAAWPLSCKWNSFNPPNSLSYTDRWQPANKHQNSTVEILLLGDKPVTQQQLFEVKATAYSSRSTITQSSVFIPALKGMTWKSLTVERAKTSMGRW